MLAEFRLWDSDILRTLGIFIIRTNITTVTSRGELKALKTSLIKNYTNNILYLALKAYILALPLS